LYRESSASFVTRSLAEFGRWVRGHWGIENGLLWVLDVVFREDRRRIRAGNAGANLAMIRREAVSLLRRAPRRGSGVTKRLKAGWDDEYLLLFKPASSAPSRRSSTGFFRVEG
jgi:hypothetical protein